MPNPKWSRDELILALAFYHQHYPNFPPREIKELSNLLRRYADRLGLRYSESYRNVNGVHMRLNKFHNSNPKDPRTGLYGGSKLDEEIYREFSNDKELLFQKAEQIKQWIMEGRPETSPRGADVEFIKKFIGQASTSNQKTKGLFPVDIKGLRVDVSFGSGSPAKVPWMAFLGPGMSPSNGFFPGVLYFKERNKLVLNYGVSETTVPEKSWPNETLQQAKKVSELIKEPPRYKNARVFKHYDVRVADSSVRFLSNGKEISEDKIYEELSQLIFEYKKCLDNIITDNTSTLSKGLFYMEQHLEDFIIDNWEQTEIGKKYELVSRQYKTEIGIIDILAKDRKTDELVVIELKKNQTNDVAVGQIARYMGWVKENMNCKGVKGIIIASAYDEKLEYALKMMNNVEMFRYEVSFKLKK